MGAPEVLSVVFVLCIFVLPIVVVVWVAKASGRYQRNVRLSALLTGSRQLEPVGVGLRLLAFIIDLVVLGIAIGSIAAAIDAAAGHQSEAAAAIVALAGWFGYFGGMETIWGATLGKMALRLRVIRGDGQHPGLWAALVRSFCKFYGAFSLVGIVVTIVCITGSPAAQRFGDRLAGTTVVRRPKLGLQTSWPSVPPPVPKPPVRPAPSPAGGLEVGAPEVSAVTTATPIDEQVPGATVSAPLAQDAASAGRANYCGRCGSKFDFDDDRFCPRCGQVRAAGA